MDTIIFGDGPLGRAVASAIEARGDPVRLVGRPPAGRHDPAGLAPIAVAIEASRADAVRPNVEAALAAGCRRFILATTGWDPERGAVEAALARAGAAAVVAPNLSLGAALFFRIVERAAALLGSTGAFEPYVLEWHRRSKRDRPSGTARELVRRIESASRAAGAATGSPEAAGAVPELEVAVIRAGASPGMHLVGFDAPGETIELRLTARDRSAYAAGALAAADWLTAAERRPGLHPFDEVVDDIVAPTAQRPAPVDRPAVVAATA
ncbi:MAG TPA: dihydrodipicolinate reductase C-terminal domain-containing protein [Candidatus Limnocylindrales bacterium]|nr:dihydrodipicolinate reductase C-terminal domain-containing protein [Candidatus Limnocylindrales bacterium]